MNPVRLILCTLSGIALLATSLTTPQVQADEAAEGSIYRVADASAAPASTPAAPAAAVPAPAATPASPFDVTRQPNEHPLVPVVRALKLSQQTIDEQIRDYSCTLVKRERLNGELGEYQYINMKVMHAPFSVYMQFVQPHAGREVAYVDGQNEGKLVVLEAGIKRYLGKMNLDPEGTLAMKDQKHPITRVGFRNLTTELGKVFEAEMKFAECDVTHSADAKIHGRPATMFQIVHPTPRQAFRAHILRVFFDNELRVPIHYDAYGWPAQQGAQPPLEESYTYQNLKINNGFTARDFDANNNPEIFK